MTNWKFNLTCIASGLLLIILAYAFIPKHQMIETRLHFPIFSAFMIVALKLWLDRKIANMASRILVGLSVGYIVGILAQLMVIAWVGTLIKFLNSSLLLHLPLNPLLIMSVLMGVLIFTIPNIIVDKLSK